MTIVFIEIYSLRTGRMTDPFSSPLLQIEYNFHMDILWLVWTSFSVEDFDFLLWRIFFSFISKVSALAWALLFLIKEASIISSATFTFSSIAFAFVNEIDFDEGLDFALDFEPSFEFDFELHLYTWSDLLDFSPSSN